MLLPAVTTFQTRAFFDSCSKINLMDVGSIAQCGRHMIACKFVRSGRAGRGLPAEEVEMVVRDSLVYYSRNGVWPLCIGFETDST